MFMRYGALVIGLWVILLMSACATTRNTPVRSQFRSLNTTTYFTETNGLGQSFYRYCTYDGHCYEEACDGKNCQGTGDVAIKQKTLAEKVLRDREERRKDERLHQECAEGRDDSCVWLASREEREMSEQDFADLERFRQICERPTLDCRIGRLPNRLAPMDRADWESMFGGKSMEGRGRGRLLWSKSEGARVYEVRKRL